MGRGDRVMRRTCPVSGNMQAQIATKLFRGKNIVPQAALQVKKRAMGRSQGMGREVKGVGVKRGKANQGQHP